MTPAGRVSALTARAPKGQHPRNLAGTRTGRDRHLWSGPPDVPGRRDRRGASQRPRSSGEGSMTDFAVRHIGPSPAQQRHMLGRLGYSSLDELTTAALPEGTEQAPLHLPAPLTETEALAELRRMAGRNQVLTSMI